MVTVLATAGVGLYSMINNVPESVPPEEAGPMPEAPPQIEMGDMKPVFSPPGDAMPAGFAPPFSGAGSTSEPVTKNPFDGSAPPFVPSTTPEQTSPPPTAASVSIESPVATPLAQTADPQSPSEKRAMSLSPARHPSYPAAQAAATGLLQQGDLDGALMALTPWYRHASLTPDEQQDLTTLLGQLAGTVVYSTDYHIGSPYTVVSADETLEALAMRFQVPAELLAKINGLEPGEPLSVGQTLKVVSGPFRAVVNVTERELVLLLGDRYAGRFQVGIGREKPQVQGQYLVTQKMVDPPYYDGQQTIEAGRPDNPLGGYWIGLAQVNGNQAPFGIHGTPDASSLNREQVEGFIRLAPRDAEDAYYILGDGSQVTVRR